MSIQTPDTPQLTPIEKAIAELDKRININGGLDVATLQWIKAVVLTDLLPYEAARDRKIAEEAWEASLAHKDHTLKRYDSGFSWMLSDKTTPDKQTYLNQNHPL